MTGGVPLSRPALYTSRTSGSAGTDLVNDKESKRVEAHLRRTFANQQIGVRPRPKQKDSAEVYIGDEFVGVIYEDEDEAGSFMFEMAILSEDLA